MGDAEDSSLPSFWLDHLLLHCKFAYVLWSEVFFFFLNIWDPVGDAEDNSLPLFWLVELAGEGFL